MVSDIRTNILNSQAIIYSRKRNNRPGARIGIDQRPSQQDCPFCPGNEHQTPPASTVLHSENMPEWTLRIVPNKYPIVDQGDPVNSGIHEVVIETAVHNKSIFQYSVDEMMIVLSTIQVRLKQISKNKSIKYVTWFRNNGRSAGASIDHAHSQLVGLPYIPEKVRENSIQQKDYFRSKKSCHICDWQRSEQNSTKYVSNDNPSWMAIQPQISRVAFETWIVPKLHTADFRQLNEHQLADLSLILLETLAQVEQAAGTTDHNLYLDTFINAKESPEAEHLKIVILPKTSHIAGFEWSTGMFVNPVTPEEASSKMRTVKFNSGRGYNEAV